MTYRIVQVNYKNGTTEFRVDRKYCGLFWLREAVRDTLDGAKEYIKFQQYLDGFTKATETVVKLDE